MLPESRINCNQHPAISTMDLLHACLWKQLHDFELVQRERCTSASWILLSPHHLKSHIYYVIAIVPLLMELFLTSTWHWRCFFPSWDPGNVPLNLLASLFPRHKSDLYWTKKLLCVRQRISPTPHNPKMRTQNTKYLSDFRLLLFSQNNFGHTHTHSLSLFLCQLFMLKLFWKNIPIPNIRRALTCHSFLRLHSNLHKCHNHSDFSFKSETVPPFTGFRTLAFSSPTLRIPSSSSC